MDQAGSSWIKAEKKLEEEHLTDWPERSSQFGGSDRKATTPTEPAPGKAPAPGNAWF
jgi:hypothetical protein